MTIFASARLIEEWAAMRSSLIMAEELVSLFTDECVCEDVTMGVLNHRKAEVGNFHTLVLLGYGHVSQADRSDAERVAPATS